MYPLSHYRCQECGHQATNRKALATHVAREHTDNAFKCDHCDFITKYQANFWRHKRTLHGLQSINICERCGTKFPTKDSLVNHTRQEHPELLDEVLEKVSKPLSQQETSASTTGLRRRENRFEVGAYLEVDEDDDHEESEEHSIEDLLEQEFTEGTKELDNEEANSQPSSKRRTNVQRSHLCRDCDFVTKESRDYLIHRKEVHCDRLTIYDCPWCSYASRQLQKLQRHCASCHVGVEPGLTAEDVREVIKKVAQDTHEAAQLEKESNIIAQYLVSDAESSPAHEEKDHRRPPASPSNSLNQWYTCRECAFKARNRKIVEDHERTSHGLEANQQPQLQFRCDLCGFACRDVAKYRQHVKSHDSPQTHNSSSPGGCSSSATDNNKAERRTKCDKCDFTSSYRWSLDRHVKYHNPLNGDLHCDRCDYSSNQAGSLKFHMSNHHQGPLSSSLADSTEGINCADEGEEEEEQEEEEEMMQCGSSGEMEDSMPGEMEGSSIGIDEMSSQDDEGDAVTCDLCGACFLNQTDLLDHNKKEHMNEIEAEQAQMFRNNPRIQGAAAAAAAAAATQSSSGQDETLARLQNRFGLSITPVAGGDSGGGGESKNYSSRAQLEVPKQPVVIELGNGKSLKHLIEGGGGGAIANGDVNAASNKTPASRSGTIFKCRYCAYSTRVKQEYQKHEHIHKPLACQLCPYKTIWKNDLNKHMTKHHGAACDQDMSPMGPPVEQGDMVSSLSLPPATGGVLRNLLSTPEMAGNSAAGGKNNESLLFKTLQGGGGGGPGVSGGSSGDVAHRQNHQQKHSQENGTIRGGTFNQEDIQNPALKLPANAHYFCPYCEFMTKTASRFHIHYMQHLNVRPFECSVCRIKSNWLWDINKHIRTRVGKGDHSHRGAKCVCINEAGLRDYSKYRCFIKEGPASGEHIETPDDQGEAGVMASQGRAHPTAEALTRPQQRSVQLQQQSAAQAVVQQVVQAQLGAVSVGQLLVGQGMTALQQQQQQQMQQQNVNKTREDSQNYMIQQLQKKEHQRASAVATAPQQQQQQGGALKCGHCEYTCDHKDIMLGHLGAHADVLPFICSKCGLANKWHHTAWIHLQQFHRDEQVTLKDIHLQLDYRQNGEIFQMADSSSIVNLVLVAPNSEVSLIRQLRCSRCPYHTVQKSNMQRHREGHSRARPDLMRYKCPYCDFWQETRRSIQRHMALHPEHVKRGTQGVLDTNGMDQDLPPGSLGLSGSILGDVNTTGSGENAETMISIPSSDSIGLNAPKFKCDSCPYTTTANSQFIYHKQFHRYNPKAKFKCDKCSYWATHAHLITQHARVHQEGTPDQKFPEGSWLPPAEIAVTTEASSSDRIRSFRVVKNGIVLKMHKCRFCPLMNRRKANVRYHELLHGEGASGRYTCHLCSYRTHSQGVLGNHMKIHVPQRARRDDVGVEMIEEIEDVSSDEEGGAGDGPTELITATAVEAAAAAAAAAISDHVTSEKVIPPPPPPPPSSKPAASTSLSAPRAQPVTKIKYNCSAVESELFNLLQSRQNGSSSSSIMTSSGAGDDEATSHKSHKLHTPSQTSGLARVKKTPKTASVVAADPYVRRSDGLITFQSKVNLRKWIACPECPALFMNPTEYSRHLDHHRYSDKFHCSQCSYSMNKYVFVAQHEQVHTEDYMVKKLGYCHRPTEGAGDHKHTLKDNVPLSFPSPASVASEMQNSNKTTAASSPSGQSSGNSTTYKILSKSHHHHHQMSPGKKQQTPSQSSSSFHVALSEDASNNYSSEEYSVALLMAELHESKAVFEGLANGTYKCSSCPAAFANQAVQRFHANLHRCPARRLKCHVCSYSIDETANMAAHAQLHYTRHHITKPAIKQCPKCPATFTKQNFFEGHLLRHGSGERYRCEHCDFATNKSDIISRHRVLHRQSDEAEFVIANSGCEDTLDTNSQLSMSTLFRNASVPQTLVEEAGPPMSLESVIKTPESDQIEEERKVFACTACPYTHSRKDGMQHHMKRHIITQTLACVHCQFTANNPTTLREHVKTHFVASKIYRPQAFLHYDDLRIKLEDGEILFEDRGPLDATRFFPDSIPELIDESRDLLVEYIEPDVFVTINHLLDDVCADRRRMEREVSSSSIYGSIVRRGSSLRASQDEPPTKRSKITCCDSRSGSSTPRKMSVEDNNDLQPTNCSNEHFKNEDSEVSNNDGFLDNRVSNQIEPKMLVELKQELSELKDKSRFNKLGEAEYLQQQQQQQQESDPTDDYRNELDNSNRVATHGEEHKIFTDHIHNGNPLENGNLILHHNGRDTSNGDESDEGSGKEADHAQEVLNTIVSHVAQSMLHV